MFMLAQTLNKKNKMKTYQPRKLFLQQPHYCKTQLFSK